MYKYIAGIALAFAIVAGPVLAQGMPVSTDGTDPKSWDPKLDAVAAAPKNHTVIYEDNEVRVLSVKVAPGEKEVPHHHRWPSVIVFVDAPKRENRDAAGNLIPDRSSPEEKRASPMVVRMPAQAAHSVTNLDTTSLHLIRIEYKNGFPGAPANP